MIFKCRQLDFPTPTLPLGLSSHWRRTRIWERGVQKTRAPKARQCQSPTFPWSSLSQSASSWHSSHLYRSSPFWREGNNLLAMEGLSCAREFSARMSRIFRLSQTQQHKTAAERFCFPSSRKAKQASGSSSSSPLLPVSPPNPHRQPNSALVQSSFFTLLSSDDLFSAHLYLLLLVSRR